MGVVADDITGANDIGSMFANAGHLVHVYASDSFASRTFDGAHDRPDICIVDTNSRLDTQDEAYRKVFTATRQLQEAGYNRYFNKTCSVFRGNVGVEFDAMLDALEEEFALVVLGFPKNGRLTIDGIHYVHGERLEASPFRHDPIHPAAQSNLVEILQAQTRRKVALLNHRVIAGGVASVRECVEAMRGVCNYLIADVPDQAALRTIAQASEGCRVYCGSSALAEELPRASDHRQASSNRGDLPPRDGLGVLCAAGSLTPQTRMQIEHLRTEGVPAVELNTLALFDAHEQVREIERIVASLGQYLTQGHDALVYAANHPNAVEQTQAEGSRRKWSRADVGRLVESSLAKIVAQVLHKSGGRRLVVAGGETSAAVCRELGVHGMRIWKEIQPGLPSCVSLGTPSRLLVLKSGSFGSPNFLQEALDHLRSQ